MSKRCNLFHDNGEPRRLANGQWGCPRELGQCRFVHPEESKWKDLPPSAPPPNRYLVDDPRHPDWRPADISAMGNTTPPPHRRGYPRRSRSPSPIYYDHRGGRYHPEDDDRFKIRVDERKELPVNGKDERSNAVALPKPVQPPPPVVAPPLPMPPPLPTPPSFLTSVDTKSNTNAAPTKADLTPDEKRKLWTERLKRISNSITAHSEFKALSSEVDKCRRLANAWTFAQLPPEDKLSLNTRLAQLESECQEKRKQRDEFIAQLVESESWPIVRGSQQEDYGHQKLFTYVGELRNTITEMNKLLVELVEQRNARGRSPVPPGLPEDAMDVDNNRPLKRRRVSPNGNAKGPRGETIAPKELEHVQDKLIDFERNLSDFENSLTQHDRELEDEMVSRMEQRFDEIVTAKRLPPSVASAPDIAKPASGLMSEASMRILREIEKNVNITGDQVGELAQEVGNLIMQSSSHEKEISHWKKEKDLFTNRLLAMEQRQKEYIQQQEKQSKEMSALTAAVAAFLAKPPSPPQEPVPDEYVLQTIEGPVLESFRANVHSVINELRESMKETMRLQKADVFETVLGMLAKTQQENTPVPAAENAPSNVGG